MVYHVYQITCIKNGKLYIGYTKNNVEKRFKQHCSAAYHEQRLKNTKLSRAIRQHGVSAFSIIVLESHDDKNVALQREREIIREKQSIEYGYNITKGGEGGGVPGPRPGIKGENNPFFGKQHSDETKKRIADREYARGEKHHLYGKPIPTSFKSGAEHPRAQSIVIDGTSYESLTQAAKSLGVSKRTLKNIGRPRKPQPNTKSIVYEGVLYESIGAASRATGHARQTIRKHAVYDDLRLCTEDTS